MITNARLISNYAAVDKFRLREAGRPQLPPADRVLSTHSLEYYVEFSTMCSACRVHPGIQAQWNCRLDGPPTPSNLRKWLDKHEGAANAAGVELLVVKADVRRSDDEHGAIVASYEL